MRDVILLRNGPSQHISSSSTLLCNRYDNALKLDNIALDILGFFFLKICSDCSDQTTVYYLFVLTVKLNQNYNLSLRFLSVT